ncbi:hypothetical protein CISG_03260 [Coccidioides immitis RMSCC 3703]|uniref:SNF2 N-terminal domain-containing protein n=1 Tax=Coccidioides immitis RMSCC 3703 TaxID=454286 RepID=A0A0J8QK58_COCIT|nr:hypothetical protein CISG_03260 [Coccidioides immitis RMSCC 3703]
MKSYPDITRRSEQESEFDSEPEGHVAGPTLSDEVDSEGDIEGLESDKDDAVAQEGSSKRVAKAGSKDGQVLERVKYHIETMPPEVLRGTYTVMPTPKPKRGLDQSLPPISRIEDIFDDLVAKAEKNGFDGFLSHIGSRELRVASMCSGTEAPLLALDMIADSFKRLFGRSFHLHHLFSAEIEPFKQSYIQRNFSPAILFRDVNELVNDEATTAFGSMRKVPTNPDLLVAGFSCVDFSQLNAHKKSLEDMGESGHTFFPILQYVKRCRPPLVILENVHSAPWAKIMEVYQKIDYNAYHAFIDTKNFYLPQTRERGYLLCIDQRKLETEPPTKKGAKTSLLARMMKSFQRPASSPVTHFLLKHDDPRLRVGVNDISVQVGKDRQAVDWTRYKARHLGYRMENGLGDKRPLTRWQDNGTCQMPDFYWHGWTKTQTERVWDTLDVNFLRAIVRKSDFMSKCRVIDLSQGLDRELDQRASGISGCLTPRGQHFISTRGGPLLGIEALALQGIPTDRLLLSSESQRDLHDLAGNAMSSPVVGAAILCALIAGHKALLPGPPRVDEPETPHCVSLPHSVRQDCPMRDVSVELSAIASEPIKDILSKGHRSCRLCFCEGQSGTRRRDMLKCSKCNHTACVRCGRNPSHVYEPIPEKELALRIAPIDFEIYIKMNFPMRLQLKGLTQELFEQFREPWTSKEVLSAWKAFMGTVSLALGEELRFSGISRQRSWTVTAEWLFFALPGKHEPSNSPLRQILSHPIAHLGQTREVIAQLQPDWDAFELGQESQTVKTWFRRWTKSPNTSLTIGNLPRASTEPSLNWRLCIDIAGFVRQRLPKLVETNNKDDVENIQPPGFKKYSLRPEQLRSLTWMRAQESPEVQPFEEEEVVEALLPVINWRAEGKATVEKLVRGGILGDDVGYGKTAISLGLIDAQFENDLRTVPDSRDGPIAIKATLIVVPYHLFDQWLREIDKFLGSKYRVLQIKTIIALRPLDITEIEKADIVLMSASIFRGVHYYELMRLFGAVPEVPKAEGRVFDEWLRDAVNGIHNHLRLLRTQEDLDVFGVSRRKMSGAI